VCRSQSEVNERKKSGCCEVKSGAVWCSVVQCGAVCNCVVQCGVLHYAASNFTTQQHTAMSKMCRVSDVSQMCAIGWPR